MLLASQVRLRAEAKRNYDQFDAVASTKVKEIMNMQSQFGRAARCCGWRRLLGFPVPHGVRKSDFGRGPDFEFDGLKVAVDQMSSMYLEGIEIDYIEPSRVRIQVQQPQVKSTCGCAAPSASIAEADRHLQLPNRFLAPERQFRSLFLCLEPIRLDEKYRARRCGAPRRACEHCAELCRCLPARPALDIAVARAGTATPAARPSARHSRRLVRPQA